MKSYQYRKYCLFLVGIFPAIALASLGGNADSVQVDQAHMHASTRIVHPGSEYAVHEIQTSAGTTVKEYISPGGQVFAVIWSGPSQPDMHQLLGQYFSQYLDSAKAPHVGHKNLVIRQPELVVQSTGHMRSFSGRAYLPQAIPQGVSIEELR